MKICVNQTNEKTKGLVAAFHYLGHDAWAINSEVKSIHDILAELRPQLYIYDRPTSTEDHEAGKKYNAQLVSLGLDKAEHEGVKYYFCGVAANPLQYAFGEKNPRAETDIFIPSCPHVNIPKVWAYIEHTVKCKCKIVGQTKCLSKYYVGSTTDKELSSFFCSTKTVWDFHGQFCYDAAVNGVNSTVYNYNDLEHPEEFFNRGTLEVSPEPNFKWDTKEYVVLNHTYLNRAIELLEDLGEKTTEEKIKQERLCQMLLES